MEIDFSDKYHMTLFIVATENVVMAATLLLMYISGKYKSTHYKESICFLSGAMLFMAAINYLEYFIPLAVASLSLSMSIMLVAASLELHLLTYAFVVLLNNTFVTSKRIIVDFLMILLFTVPSLFVAEDTPFFQLFFVLSILFYLSKFIYNSYIYRKYYYQAQADMLDSYSDERGELIRWVNSIFYIVVVIGAVSVIVPLTNYMVLFFYNIFLFFAYFYIYIEVILHEDLFYTPIYVLPPISDSAVGLEESETVAPSAKLSAGFMVGRETLFNQWLASRAYTRSGITIEDVARELNTNRSTLSVFMNSELQLNFYDWISQLRMEEAKKELLKTPSIPIVEIAMEIGIEDRSNFDKTFKRIVGLSPAMYRKRNYASQNA